MARRPAEKPRTVKAVTATRMFVAKGRRAFVTVHLTRDKASRFLATPVPLGLSGAITTLSKADGFVEIHESQQFIDAGEVVTVHLLKPNLCQRVITE